MGNPQAEAAGLIMSPHLLSSSAGRAFLYYSGVCSVELVSLLVPEGTSMWLAWQQGWEGPKCCVTLGQAFIYLSQQAPSVK